MDEARRLAEAIRSPGLGSWRWNTTALAVFAAALALLFGEVWTAGPRSFVPVAGLDDPKAQAMSRIDVTFEAWLVARNARTLAREPWRLFDTEHCAPGENTLTLGVPMITMGLLGVPALIGGDPILSYNFAILAVLGVAAVAMYLLVTEWTGIPLAGIAAALLFAFHPVRIDRILYPAEWDASWTVLALFFSRRLFAHGRWRDAAGLALAGGLQIAASFYPTLAAAFLAVPFAVWLVAAYGFRNARPMQLAFVSFGVALAAAIVLGPYQAASGAAPGHFERSYQFYAPWQMYLPGTWFFPGWLELGLVLAGLALPRRLGLAALAGRDPRFALAGGALLVAVIAAGRLGDSILAPVAGGFAGVIPYEILARVLPGLDTVRAVERASPRACSSCSRSWPAWASPPARGSRGAGPRPRELSSPRSRPARCSRCPTWGARRRGFASTRSAPPPSCSSSTPSSRQRAIAGRSSSSRSSRASASSWPRRGSWRAPGTTAAPRRATRPTPGPDRRISQRSSPGCPKQAPSGSSPRSASRRSWSTTRRAPPARAGRCASRAAPATATRGSARSTRRGPRAPSRSRSRTPSHGMPAKVRRIADSARYGAV